MTPKIGADMFKVGSRVKVLTPDGYYSGVVISVCPEWYWAQCQCVVEFEGLGRQELPAGTGLKADD